MQAVSSWRGVGKNSPWLQLENAGAGNLNGICHVSILHFWDLMHWYYLPRYTSQIGVIPLQQMPLINLATRCFIIPLWFLSFSFQSASLWSYFCILEGHGWLREWCPHWTMGLFKCELEIILNLFHIILHKISSMIESSSIWSKHDHKVV